MLGVGVMGGLWVRPEDAAVSRAGLLFTRAELQVVKQTPGPRPVLQGVRHLDPPVSSPRILTTTLCPPRDNRCYSADSVSSDRPREAREKHGRPRCLLGSVVFLGSWPASLQRRGLRSPSCRTWEILVLQTLRRSRASPPCVLGVVVLVALGEHCPGRKQDAERTTRWRRGPGPGNYKTSSGEGGCSGSMKRTPTPEEREREAKVCRVFRSLGPFVHL